MVKSLPRNLFKGPWVRGSINGHDSCAFSKRDPLSKAPIYHDRNFSLTYFPAQNRILPGVPVFIVFALINSPGILDIHPKVSFIHQLNRKGLDVYLLHWGKACSTYSLEDYVLKFLHLALKKACEHAHQSTMTVMGICQGGVFSLCYAALHPKRIERLITLVTPCDLHVGKNRVHQILKFVELETMWKNVELIPGDWVPTMLSTIAPFKYPAQKPQNLDKSTWRHTLFERVTQWNLSSPPLAKRAFIQFCEQILQQNNLVNGRFRLGHTPVMLNTIHRPLLNVYAKNDHIWPVQCPQALEHCYLKQYYHALEFPRGHLGLFISQKARPYIDKIAKWVLHLEMNPR